MIHAVGDIVARCDIRGRTKYRVTHLATDGSGWVYARRLDGRGGIVCFPSQFMIKKVGP